MRKKILSLAVITLLVATLSATTVFAIENPFTDVSNDSDLLQPVLWALEEGITAGTSDTTFEPSATCTRGQVVTFLWRAEGAPTPITSVNPFTDVSPDAYYYNAVLWAVEEGITAGTSTTTFSPNETCTSAQVLTFLYRANGEPNATGVGEYYADAVNWATTNGIASDVSPNEDSPRSEIVTYLYRNDNISSSSPATRADVAHFLVSNFSFDSYGEIATADYNDVTSSTRYADDLLLVVAADVMAEVDDKLLGPEYTLTNASFAATIQRLLDKAGCDLSAYTVPVDNLREHSWGWYYESMTIAINLGIFSEDVEPNDTMLCGTLNDDMVDVIRSVPDGDNIRALALEVNDIYFDYVEINDKLYELTIQRYLSEITEDGNTTLYVRPYVEVEHTDTNDSRALYFSEYPMRHPLYVLLSYALGNYTIEDENNPYTEGTLSVKGRRATSTTVKITQTEEYTSITTKDVLTTISTSKASLSSEDFPETTQTIGEVKGITYIGGHLNVNELLKYFGINMTASLEVRDGIQILCIK